MKEEILAAPRLLLIDTCGDPASVGLSQGARVCALEALPRQRASAEIVGLIERMLGAARWKLAELQGIGVVRGPGSFTGVRTGLSVAKGLSEAAGLPVFAVSRLAVLAVGVQQGFAALDAGRGEVYAREISSGNEFLCSDGEMLERLQAGDIAIAEESLQERLAALRPEMRPLNAGMALPLVLGLVAGGGDDVAQLDAYYLRDESGIYRHAGAGKAVTL